MTKSILIIIIASWFFISCTNTQTEEKPKEEIPKALETETSSSSLFLKRGSGDLVESLYAELTGKDDKLKKLEHDIDGLDKDERDSTEAFNNFNDKNESYYNAANRHYKSIQDSTLRVKMASLISESLIRYNSSAAKHLGLLNVIKAKNATISDLHVMIKIVYTLPIIEKYQKENIPGSTSLEGYINRENETIRYTDSLLKNDIRL